MALGVIFAIVLLVAWVVYRRVSINGAKRLIEWGDYFIDEGAPESAFFYFFKAAKRGFAPAQCRLGNCYYNGEGVEEDKVEAVKWFRRAAEEGEEYAQNNLGVCYDKGEGVEQDQAKAVQWYRKAAKQGNADAQINLAHKYQTGSGVKKNLDKARMWLQKAADQGDSRAKKKLARIGRAECHAGQFANTEDESSDAIGRLNALIGLGAVKEDVRRLRAFVLIQRQRAKKGLKAASISYHCVFTGNPGTGKTTVARIVADIYRELGVIKKGQFVEVARQDLIGEYLGQTAVKTNKVIDGALDGVLFIDEAYSLVGEYGDDYGREAITTLLKRMEDDRDRLVLILAGYGDEMRKFIDSNPGLQSRFNRYIHFPDYSAGELQQIFEKLLTEHQFRCDDALRKELPGFFEQLASHKDKHFGNGREVRNIFEKTLARQALRLAAKGNPSKDELQTLQLSDFNG